MPARPLISITRKNTLASKLALQLLKWSSQYFANPRLLLIKDYILGTRVLEVGLGMGTLAYNMSRAGYKVAGIDVDNTSLYKEFQPIIYNGFEFPLKNNSFDTVTIVCVLHHCKDQLAVLRESMRVGKRVIVIEDTYRNRIEHFFVAFRDSFENWEWYKHQYRSYDSWKKICNNEGWKVKHIKSWSSVDFGILYGHQTLFIIDKA